MKVILKQAVPKLGKSGQVVNVKPGYARNFLFPKGMAVVAERGQLKALETINARMAAKLAETKSGAEAVGAKLNGQTVKNWCEGGRRRQVVRRDHEPRHRRRDSSGLW